MDARGAARPGGELRERASALSAPRRSLDPTVARILAAKALRTFGYGYLAILFPLQLASLGLGPRGIGVSVAIVLAGSAAMNLAARRPLERLGPRPVLLALACLTVVSGALLAAAREPALFVLGALLGNAALGMGDPGPSLSIEQVLLSRGASAARLTRALAVYHLTGQAAGALGALAVSLAAGAAEGRAAPAAFFWLFAAGGVAQALLYAGLPAAPGARTTRGRARRPSAPLIRRIAALFALDAFAGGFIVQSLLAYWFHVHFGLSPASLGAVFFGTQVLSGLSYLLAPAAAARFGLVNTMVWSHVLSNGLLLAMALAPDARTAIALLLVRHLFAQVDVPTRQAWLLSVVGDEEREAAATSTNAARVLAQSLSPALTGIAMQAVHVSAPLVLGGSLKIVYDLLLLATARRVERGLDPNGGPRRSP